MQTTDSQASSMFYSAPNKTDDGRRWQMMVVMIFIILHSTTPSHLNPGRMEGWRLNLFFEYRVILTFHCWMTILEMLTVLCWVCPGPELMLDWGKPQAWGRWEVGSNLQITRHRDWQTGATRTIRSSRLTPQPCGLAVLVTILRLLIFKLSFWSSAL